MSLIFCSSMRVSRQLAIMIMVNDNGAVSSARMRRGSRSKIASARGTMG